MLDQQPRIKTMVCGGRHSLVLTTDGTLYSFGFGQSGQLGHRSSKNMLRPKAVEDFKDKKIQLVAAGAHHSVVMTRSGDIYVCGNNKDGQLGLGDTESRNGFTLLSSMADKNAYRIFAGGNHTWILLDEFIPMRRNFRPPSPLATEHQQMTQKKR